MERDSLSSRACNPQQPPSMTSIANHFSSMVNVTGTRLEFAHSPRLCLLVVSEILREKSTSGHSIPTKRLERLKPIAQSALLGPLMENMSSLQSSMKESRLTTRYASTMLLGNFSAHTASKSLNFTKLTGNLAPRASSPSLTLRLQRLRLSIKKQQKRKRSLKRSGSTRRAPIILSLRSCDKRCQRQMIRVPSKLISLSTKR